MEVLAELDSGIITGGVAVLFSIIGFFVSRFFNKSDSVEQQATSHVTHIALIHEKLGTHSSSEQKQWAVLDSLVRDVSDLKIKVAVLERERID